MHYYPSYRSVSSVTLFPPKTMLMLDLAIHNSLARQSIRTDYSVQKGEFFVSDGQASRVDLGFHMHLGAKRNGADMLKEVTVKGKDILMQPHIVEGLQQ